MPAIKHWKAFIPQRKIWTVPTTGDFLICSPEELISSLAKHSKMNQARQHMEQAKWDLRNFSEELKDVNMISHLDIETDDFLSFADWFFDGFFVDWMVQDRINTARDQVEEAIQRLKVILRELENS